MLIVLIGHCLGRNVYLSPLPIFELCHLVVVVVVVVRSSLHMPFFSNLFFSFGFSAVTVSW